jgi:hypothetical protein
LTDEYSEQDGCRSVNGEDGFKGLCVNDFHILGSGKGL